MAADLYGFVYIWYINLREYGMTLPRYGRGPLWFCVYMVHKLTGIWYDFA